MSPTPSQIAWLWATRSLSFSPFNRKAGRPAQTSTLAATCLGLVVSLVAWHVPRCALAANKEWDGSSSQDFNTAANWTAAGVPTTDDTANIHGFSNVTLSASAGVENLIISNNGKLSTSGHLLFVINVLRLNEDVGVVSLTVNPGSVGADLDTNFVDLLSGADLIMAGGLAQIDNALNVSTDSFIQGHGTIEFTSTAGSYRLENNGTINPSGGTLTFRVTSTSVADFNLDGTLDQGNVNVISDTSTLVFDGPITDPFNRTMNVGDGNTISFLRGWILGDANILAPKGTLNLTGGAAGPATVAGTSSTISGIVNATAGMGVMTTSIDFTSTAQVSVATGATLSLAGPTTYGGGSYSGLGQLSQDGNAQVLENTTISTAIFDMDGLGGSQITIANEKTLTLNVTTVEEGSDVFDGKLVLNGGKLHVDNQLASWTMAGMLTMNGTTNTSEVSGEFVNINGAVSVTRGNRFAARVHFGPTAMVALNGDEAKLELMGVATYAGGSYTGAGELEQNAFASVNANTTIAVGVYDLDGAADTSATLVGSAKLTIQADSLEADGSDTYNGMLTLFGGDLDVSVDDGRWQMAGALALTQNGGEIPQISGNAIDVTGTINVTGTAEILALVNFEDAASVTVASGGNLRLSDASFRGIVFIPSGKVTLNGTLTIAQNAFINVPTFDWDGDTETATTSILPGAVFEVFSPQTEDDGGGFDGLVEVADAAALSVNNQAAWQIATGTLRLLGPTAEVSGSADILVTAAAGAIEGNGIIAVNVTTAGTTSPGLSAGLLRVAGNFTQQATGLLQIELGGTAFAAYDHLQVFGAATLAGTLDVDLIGGFMPSPGDQFTVLTFASRSGDFGAYTGLNLGGGLTLMPVLSATNLMLIATSSALQGDANMDGMVNIFDVNVVSANWGTTGPTGDVNHDNMVNIFDINLISANWTPTGGGSGTAVPEPSCLMLAAMALFGLIGGVYRKRRS